ncbi:MAG TPA: alpha/beta hydrolase [Anaerolineales bacterium]|nr:alpha/beta hydrolase [Anaerolineales bacterium]
MSPKQFCRNDLCLSYTDDGEKTGYPVLVQHGLIASIEDEGLFGRLLNLGHRVISIARPGYGDSSPCLLDSFAGWADLAVHVAGELGLPRFDLLGTSSGAPYAYSIAAGFPDRVRNVFIFSGIPALYDERVLAGWPYLPIKNTNMAELEALAHEWFFSGLAEADLKQKHYRDSMRNHGFGVAQDLKLRFADWGFRLDQVRARVWMRHSRTDDSVPFQTAVRTAELLPDCRLELVETGPHFSPEALDEFIEKTMLGNIGR